MEIVIIAVVAVVAIGWWIWKESKHEATGHPLDGATKSTVVEVLDVNQDGRVDVKDAVAVVEVAVEKTKKAAAKTKSVAKATVAKTKAPVKKAPAKKAAAPKKAKAK